MALDLVDYDGKARSAVRTFWAAREAAGRVQRESGNVDQGERAGVTAGKNMNGFIRLIRDVVRLHEQDPTTSSTTGESGRAWSPAWPEVLQRALFQADAEFPNEARVLVLSETLALQRRRPVDPGREFDPRRADCGVDDVGTTVDGDLQPSLVSACLCHHSPAKNDKVREPGDWRRSTTRPVPATGGLEEFYRPPVSRFMATRICSGPPPAERPGLEVPALPMDLSSAPCRSAAPSKSRAAASS